MSHKNLQISVSIGDFSPLFRRPDFLFQGLQHTGVDGVELWIGVKSRWSADYYRKLSKQYNLPIISLHQPLWAMTGMYFDEKFFILAKEIGVKHITCHPLPGISLADERMRAYFTRLSAIQTRIGIPILIENLPQAYRNGLLHHFFPPIGDTSDVRQIHKAAREFGLGVTLDTDHVHLEAPHELAWMARLLPQVGNIHLSSFEGGKRHLPPYMGVLQTKEFMQYLYRQKYTGTITLEIGWPKSISLREYDFSVIAQSVAFLRGA